MSSIRYNFPMDLTKSDEHLLGLSTAEARDRLKKDGPNEFSRKKSNGFMTTLKEVLSEPMLFILFACALLYVFLGEPDEAYVMFAFVTFVIGVTLVQRYKAEHALEALKKLVNPEAVVIRDGTKQTIPARDIVVGDLFVVEEGDRIPADAIVVSSRDCSVNESILTGESVSVHKIPGNSDCGPYTPGDETTHYLLSQTLVISGYCVGKVFATGQKTQVGTIGAMLGGISAKRTLLEREIDGLVKKMASIALVVCSLVFLLVFATDGSFIKSLLTGLSLAMTLLPEEFPVVLIIFFALGVYRLSKLSVLTRRMPVIETLGSTTVLCVDKTGTLTQNTMRVRFVSVEGISYPIDDHSDLSSSGPVFSLLATAALASDPHAVDPIDEALNRLMNAHEEYKEHAKQLSYEGSQELPYPFLRNRKYCNGDDTIIAVKGAPESIVKLCHLDGQEKDAIDRDTDAFAQRGFRVLAVARSRQDTTDSEAFDYLGLVAFEDPLRPDTKEAVAQCHDAGIRVVMITGDYPATAGHIAREIGIANAETVVTGDQLREASVQHIQELVATANIFARIQPSQKLDIVKAFKDAGEVVGMTGDGVNDAPALKSAHIGIAMGKHGTDVAREAASLVLLQDDFHSLVAAVRMGRMIYDNIKKATSYIIAIHVPIAGMALLPLAFGYPVVLLPVHIAFLELLIDPACTVVFESEEEEGDSMKRKPRPVRQPLFDRKNFILRLLQGGVAFAAVGGAYVYSHSIGMTQLAVQGVTFLSLVASNVALIASNLSWGKARKFSFFHNRAFLWLLGGIGMISVLFWFVPLLQRIIQISVVDFTPYAIAGCTACMTYVGSELVEKFESTIEEKED